MQVKDLKSSTHNLSWPKRTRVGLTALSHKFYHNYHANLNFPYMIYQLMPCQDPFKNLQLFITSALMQTVFITNKYDSMSKALQKHLSKTLPYSARLFLQKLPTKAPTEHCPRINYFTIVLSSKSPKNLNVVNNLHFMIKHTKKLSPKKPKVIMFYPQTIQSFNSSDLQSRGLPLRLPLFFITSFMIARKTTQTSKISTEVTFCILSRN